MKIAELKELLRTVTAQRDVLAVENGKVRSENRDCWARVHLLELRFSASEAELNHWQAKAEQLVRSYEQFGCLSDFEIKRMP